MRRGTRIDLTKMAQLPLLGCVLFPAQCIGRVLHVLWGQSPELLPKVKDTLALARRVAEDPATAATRTFHREGGKLYRELESLSGQFARGEVVADPGTKRITAATFRLAAILKTIGDLAILFRDGNLAKANNNVTHILQDAAWVVDYIVESVPVDQARDLLATLRKGLSGALKATASRKEEEVRLHMLQPVHPEDFKGIADHNDDGKLPEPIRDKLSPPPRPAETPPLAKLRDIKSRVLTAVASFRDEFRAAVKEMQGKGAGEENSDLAVEFNALLDLLGFDLHVPDPKNKNHIYRAYLRCKDVPGLAGGALEARAQVDGQQRPLSSRVTLPEKMVLKEKPGTHLSADRRSHAS